MKKIRKITTMLLMAATLVLTAFECGPDEEPIISLTVDGTSWVNKQHDSYEDEYGQIQESVETTVLYFRGNNQGRLTVKYESAQGIDEESMDFRYTHNTSSFTGTITISEGGVTEKYNFSYNLDNNTLTLYGTGGFYLLFDKISS